jgi:hypothetical protein
VVVEATVVQVTPFGTHFHDYSFNLAAHYPRFFIGTATSVHLAGWLARRDDEADCILLGGATTQGSSPDVQLPL